MSRLKALLADARPVFTPSIDCGQYLVDYLMDVGPTLPGAMGEVPLTQGEFRHWQWNTGIELRPWEVRALRRLSVEYLAQSQQSKQPECLPPFGPAVHLVSVADKINAVFG